MFVVWLSLNRISLQSLLFFPVSLQERDKILLLNTAIETQYNYRYDVKLMAH